MEFDTYVGNLDLLFLFLINGKKKLCNGDAELPNTGVQVVHTIWDFKQQSNNNKICLGNNRCDHITIINQPNLCLGITQISMLMSLW